MRNYLLPLLAILILSACSTPRYTYNFDYYDYNAGKKTQVAKAQVAEETGFVPAPAEEMEASTNSTPVIMENKKATTEAKAAPVASQKAKTTMTREEEKALKKEMKKELKSAIKSAKKASATMDAPGATKAMDNDLKLAIIFGAVGLVLSLFGGVSGAFWVLSVIAFVIGVVFLVKWLVRQ